ncbi:MAG: dihydropteroate synthase [Calditrichia bacterium]|nr:dihydropteroate synthase [Calditrichia bacterium]
MLRYLSGLNRQDAVQELRYLGMANPDEGTIGLLRENFAVKASGYSPEAAAEARRQLREALESVTLFPGAGPYAGDFIFCLPGTEVSELSRRIRRLPTAAKADFPSELRALLENLSRREWNYRSGGRVLSLNRPLVMGILNVTPDSFSDGGKFLAPETACRHAEAMLEAGADIIDVGGESTRPGSDPVSLKEEWARVEPAIRCLAKHERAIISIDTYKSEIARRALQEGAHIINDISAMMFDAQMAETAAEFQAPVALMHIQGMPKTMQANPVYGNLMEEIAAWLGQRCRFAAQQGVTQLIIDPGIGFGKRLNDNYELLRRLGELRSLGYPILLGASRKSFIGNLLNAPPEARAAGSLAAALYGVAQGASILRVHDVAETQQALAVQEAIRERKA